MELIYALLNMKKDLVKKRGDAQISKKLDEFEQLISEKDDLADQDISLNLYGKRNLSTTYYSLKYRMEERLMNDILILCSLEEDLASNVKSSIQIEKITLISQILQKSSFRKQSMNLFERGLKLSKKNLLPHLVIRQLTFLLPHYSFVEPDPNKMNVIIKELDYYLEFYQCEIYIRKCNAIFSHMYVTNKGGFNQKQLNEMEEMVTKMQEIKTKFKSNYIVAFVNDLSFFYYQSIGNYGKGLEIATYGLEENLALPVKELLGIYQSKKNIALSHFYLKNYHEANKWFLEIIDMVTYGDRNWFNTTSLYYLNLIYARDYEKLLELSISVLYHKNLSKFPYFEEQWKLREAYLHFLIKSEIIKLDEHQKKAVKPFSLSKFINSVPFHAKDKSGQNITIIIIQVLFLLLDNKYGKIIDKIDSLTQYTYRYLHKDETFRSNCFIKMLLLMIKADFHPARTVALTSDLMKKLKNSHLITDEKSTQVEIIPYDYLWELIIEILKDKQKK